MPSSNKTPNLGLNNWSGTDKPKRADFVQDNQLIDAAVHNHAADTDLHCSPEDRARLNQLVSTGFYVGNGASERTLALSFSPSFALVFAHNAAPVSTANGAVCTGFASQNYASAGVALSGASLTLSQAAGSGNVPAVSLNESGKAYGYLLLR